MQRIFKIPSGVKYEHIFYLAINIYVSFVGFLRSFVFMKYLNMGDLGTISLIQTVILFISLLQFGLINGGYRIFSLDRADEQNNVNNLLFSFFGLISLSLSFFWVVLKIFNVQLIISNNILLVAIVSGIFSLITNWLTNTLIGKRKIKEINKINFISTTISLLILPTVTIWGMYGAIASLILQPLLFVVITLILHKDLRPKTFNLNIRLARHVLSFGFIPFLAGIFVILNTQIERWSIAQILGTEALGNYYLVFLYSTLFIILPSSLLNIFFPKAIYSYENGSMPSFRNLILIFTRINIIYLTVVGLLTFFTLQLFIDIILPLHSNNTRYVIIYLPGLIANILSNTFSLIFNSCLQLKPLLVGGIISVFFTFSLLFILRQLNLFSLTNVTICKSVISLIVFIYYLMFMLSQRKKIFKLT